MLRLTGGRFKGRGIQTPAHLKTRPTLSKLRQALFNSIQGQIEGARVLDLFAGSGALGFEALSRGAGSVVFVEKDRVSQKIILKNAETLGVASAVEAGSKSVEKSWNWLKEKEPFDLVLMDPPYLKGWEIRVLNEAPWEELLRPGAVVVVEWGKRTPEHQKPPKNPGKLVKIREKAYGDTILSSYRFSKEVGDKR